MSSIGFGTGIAYKPVGGAGAFTTIAKVTAITPPKVTVHATACKVTESVTGIVTVVVVVWVVFCWCTSQ